MGLTVCPPHHTCQVCPVLTALIRPVLSSKLPKRVCLCSMFSIACSTHTDPLLRFPFLKKMEEVPKYLGQGRGRVPKYDHNTGAQKSYQAVWCH